MTYDQAAASYLLAGKPIPQALLRDAAQAFGEECPECGNSDTESNGSTEFRCCACDHRWGHEYGERYGF
jgi:hypothetical protein